MDIISDATLDPFYIGPKTIVGRAIAFKILFCNSMSHLRHQMFRVALNYVYKFGNGVAPIISWLHPGNPQGMLALATIMALLLRRFTNVKAKAEMAYRRKFWRNVMRAAQSYEEWAHAAQMLERDNPMKESDFYDEELIRNKLQELRQSRQEDSLREIMFCLRVDPVRNVGNMCNPDLHKGRLQVPKLIKEYIDEVSTQLRIVCDSSSEELLLEEKLSLMHETRHAFGRTALLLSGGASLGAFHVGVVKTLVNHKLLPRIVSGSSVGSILCSIVATRSWPEIQTFMEDSWLSFRFFDQLGGLFTIVKRIMTRGAVHEIRQLQSMLRHLTSNLTFQEAYDMTGRVLGITVCSSRKHEPPRCLNYLTSPHVVIWSAVTASCAFPGLFEAQELMAKDRSGNIVPYHPPFNLDPEDGPSARRWRDGSLEIDLPMMQLKELFNVNHFIVSQANPHIAPFLRIKEIVRAYGGNFAAKLAHLVEMEVKHRCNQFLELGFRLGGLAKLFAQDWEGDVTVVMPATLAQYSKIIQNPSPMELQNAANQGRRCTWEKLSAIKANCGIELALDECVAILNHMRRLKRSAERAAASSHGLASTHRFNASKRIPSWNVISRDNSTGSLQDLTDAMSPSYQGIGSKVANASHNLQGHRGTHDGSDSESDGTELTSWTKSGGPLMRTNSGNKFVDFIQNLEVSTEKNQKIQMVSRDSYYHSPRRTTPGTSSSDSDFYSKDVNGRSQSSSSSIMIAEGDLLQTERVHSGILLNVLKKEHVTLSNTIRDLQDETSEIAENVQVDCKDLDASSESKTDHDDVEFSHDRSG